MMGSSSALSIIL